MTRKRVKISTNTEGDGMKREEITEERLRK